MVGFGTFFQCTKMRKSFVQVSTDYPESQSQACMITHKSTHRMIPKKISEMSLKWGKILPSFRILISRWSLTLALSFRRHKNK